MEHRAGTRAMQTDRWSRLLYLGTLLLVATLGSSAGARAANGTANQSGQAPDGWTFGIGTSLSSFALDGEIGFATPQGGAIFDVDLDNGETSDLAESAVGLRGFAARGPIRIVYGVGRTVLEDQEPGLEASWERTQTLVAVIVGFAHQGNHGFGALAGVRHLAHDWELTTQAGQFAVEEDFTDGLLGLTHAYRFGRGWSWTNRVDAGFGDSEQAWRFVSGVGRRIGRHWKVQLDLRRFRLELGEASQIDAPDFYLYDVDETSLSAGFLYLF